MARAVRWVASCGGDFSVIAKIAAARSSDAGAPP
ncbi:MAG: hypothetical protein ACJA1L_003530, partial [Paracoccaceae bacterium]